MDSRKKNERKVQVMKEDMVREDRIERLDRQIAELEKKTKKLQTDRNEKLREKKREERKARTHRLIQLGAVIENVLGRPITDDDIPKLLDLLRFLEDEDEHYFSEAMNGVLDYRRTK